MLSKELDFAEGESGGVGEERWDLYLVASIVSIGGRAMDDNG